MSGLVRPDSGKFGPVATFVATCFRPLWEKSEAIVVRSAGSIEP
jgi:hypothetical protein